MAPLADRLREADLPGVRVQQTDLFAASLALPAGLTYAPGLIDEAQEQALVRRFAGLEFRAFEFCGFLGKRRVVSFGTRYDFAAARLQPAPPVPGWLRPLRAGVAAFAGMEEAAFEHAMITEYAPGAPIGWHRDRPEFEVVAGVSLLSPCTFRLRRRSGAGWERRSFVAEPRSAYVLSGPARREWEHSIPPVEALRYSVTFRTLAAQAAARSSATS